MQATVVDLRRRLADILKAIDRNERVTILHRGKVRAVLVPPEQAGVDGRPISDKPDPTKHPAFGMWADREDMKDPVAWVRAERKRWRRVV
jgi:antitoxin (DNA-binding transcriptional repressor) of toxin-antitoxin stability system